MGASMNLPTFFALAISSALLWTALPSPSFALTEAECRKIYDRGMADLNNPRIYSAPNARTETEGALRVCRSLNQICFYGLAATPRQTLGDSIKFPNTSCNQF